MLRTTWLFVCFGYEHSLFYRCDSFFIVNILFHPQSAFYPWSAVCSLHFTLSLHFTPGLQSAVCSLRFTLTGTAEHFQMRQQTKLKRKWNRDCIRRSHPTWLERQCKPVQSRAKMQLFSVTVLCSINKSFCRRILLGSRNLRLETLKLEAGSWKLETRNSKLETRNSKLKTQNSKLETRNSKLEARSSKLEARNSKLEPRNSSLETRALRNRKLRGSSFEFQVETVTLPLTGTVHVHVIWCTAWLVTKHLKFVWTWL